MADIELSLRGGRSGELGEFHRLCFRHRLDDAAIGSVFATLLFLRTAYRDFLPPELHRFISFLLRDLMARFNNNAKIVIEEYDASSHNELYGAVQIYLGAHCLDDAAVVRLTKHRDSPLPAASLPAYHTTYDSFQGIPIEWKSVVVAQADGSGPSGRSSRPAEHHSLKLTFHNRHRHAVRSLYIPHVLEEAKRIAIASRQRRLFTNRADTIYGDDRRNLWSPVPFSHPSTFDTLAIDPALRDDIRRDLLRFVGRRDYYARVGRSWKRGYLLHGPPGTGKTSLIAAIANLLEFDVYDLELTAVHSNTALRRLLASTTPKSVVVIEDADCSLDLTDRKKKKKNKQDEKNAKTGEAEEEPTPASDRSGFSTVSLSGVLNFVDGLWSSSVGERLMILTTNHPERLDPAMLRPGRMDRKIHLSYCGPEAFRVLARNYLEVGEEHPRMVEAEELLREVEMTPAEVAEVFMRCDAEGEGADAAMDEVVIEMRRRKQEGAGGREVDLM
ncbi:AAA-ATPase At3g50940-like [Zingiber officinale]|uniref:AAA-ATPase At3g50940-like n=1 Tax=Zingiber officinale TaxID=94328 RepID=UPI001C4C9357|nr:AAA-ATPase At3g50940-like [Zingiber officinale]